MSHPTILLIDFDVSSIQHAKSSLTQAGYHVEVARDGVSGLEAFERLKPDLVLVEAMLPKKHGFEVCQEIKKTPYGKCTPILITSSEALGAKYVKDAVQLYGCDEYVEKPVSDAELVGFCQRLLPEVVVSPPSVVVPLESNPDSQRLDDLSEDELMQRLDELIDRATETESEPPAESALDEQVGGSADDPDLKPLGDVDLVAFCERVFPHADSEATPGPAASTPQAPPPSRTRSSARLLNEEEVMGQLDALARNDPSGGTLRQAHSPIKSEISASVEALMDLEPPTSWLTAWPPQRRSNLVWRTGIAGGVLVSVGLILLAVAQGRLAVGPQDPPDFALAGPIATPPTSVDASAKSVLWDAMPVVPTSTGSRGDAQKSASHRAVVSAPRRQPEPAVDPRPAPAEPETIAAPPATAPPASDLEPTAAAPDEATVEAEPDSVTSLVSSGPFGTPKASLFEFSMTADEQTSSVVDQPPAGQSSMFPAFQPESAAIEPAAAPAPVTTREGELVPIDSVDTLPIPLEQSLPDYDDQSRRMRRQGTVVLRALIDERGAVSDVQLVEGIPRSRLNDAAIEAVSGWSYRAATRDGVPVKVWKTISLEFRL